jgi:HSP20 family protein
MNLVKRKANYPVKRAIRKYQPTYYDPFKSLWDLVDYNYSSLFDNGTQYSGPAINMMDEGNRYVVEVSVPGYTEDNLNVSIDGDQLTVSGQYTTETENNSSKYFIRERAMGTFSRTVTLPKEAYIDEAAAHLEKGILSLYIPKNEGALEPRTITIVNKD